MVYLQISIPILNISEISSDSQFNRELNDCYVFECIKDPIAHGSMAWDAWPTARPKVD